MVCSIRDFISLGILKMKPPHDSEGGGQISKKK